VTTRPVSPAPPDDADIEVYKNPAPGVPGNLTTHGVGASNWLAGIDIDSFPGATIGERVARAAASIKADFLSPVATSASKAISM
jgi:GH25 family lysozyme M1 (1,4-beta-N-acetylmuramidase)